MSREIDLTIVIVAYNARGLLDECLASLFLHTSDLECEVIVVEIGRASCRERVYVLV